MLDDTTQNCVIDDTAPQCIHMLFIIKHHEYYVFNYYYFIMPSYCIMNCVSEALAGSCVSAMFTLPKAFSYMS